MIRLSIRKKRHSALTEIENFVPQCKFCNIFPLYQLCIAKRKGRDCVMSAAYVVCHNKAYIDNFNGLNTSLTITGVVFGDSNFL